MNTNDVNKKMRIGFQIAILVVTAFNFTGLALPSTYSNKSTLMLTGLIVSCVGLVYIMVRVCMGNVKRWEMILYNILNLVFVYIIINSIRELSYARARLDRSNAIDDDAYDDAEGIGLSAAFMFVLFGIPCIVMTLIFTIIGLVRTCVNKETTTQVVASVPQATARPINANTVAPNNAGQLMYCRHCGQQIAVDANFCKYCGKQLK